MKKQVHGTIGGLHFHQFDPRRASYRGGFFWFLSSCTASSPGYPLGGKEEAQFHMQGHKHECLTRLGRMTQNDGFYQARGG